ncbi:MAG: hypothetical protein ACYTBP_11075 [Planctomycetota bacterium]|jgi:hypothetical protein
MRYRKNVRADVTAELAAHFVDELRDCQTDEEKEKKAKQIIVHIGSIMILTPLTP